MSGLSSQGEQVVLAAILTASTYISLHTADPGDDGAAEVVVPGNGYSRQVGTFSNSGANPTVASNNAIISYPSALMDWGTVSFFGVWGAQSGGGFLGSGPLDVSRLVLSGDTVRFLTGALKVTAD